MTKITPSPIEGGGVAGLLEQVSRTVQLSCFRENLHPVQWSALRYFHAAPPTSRTLTGLAKFQGLSVLSAASKTVNALVRKGLLDVSVNPNDRRSRRLDVTEAGRDMLAKDPLLQVTEVISNLPEDDQKQLAGAMEILVMQVLPGLREPE